MTKEYEAVKWETRGRPPRYNPAMQIKAENYLKNHEALGDTMPSLAGLAVYLDVCKQSLYEWAKREDGEPFVRVLSMLKCRQERALLNGGLDGTLNATISKLVLSKHGYQEKTRTDHSITGEDGKTIDTTWNVQVRAVEPMRNANVNESIDISRKDNVNEDQNNGNCDKIDPLLSEIGGDRDIPNSNI